MLVEFILLTDQSFRVVEESSFRDLLQMLNRELKISSRTVIRSDVTNLYQSEKERILTLLKVQIMDLFNLSY